MKYFEYKLLHTCEDTWKEYGNMYFDDGSNLTYLGEQGWELCTAFKLFKADIFIFKKEL
jgi:hypothetical protein